MSMRARAEALSTELSRLRREIHTHPELGFQEVRTAALVSETLREIGGISVRTNVGITGVVGDLGTGDGPTIGIRADMDALPIHETTGLGFGSVDAGKMHACGHDAHTAILLGVAHLLKEEFATGKLKGNVRFLFQPAEEIGGDGVSGAPKMIADGALTGVDHVIALHVLSTMKYGEVMLPRGPNTAASDSFRGVVRGTGGHGAAPHNGTDPVWMANIVISALFGICARKIDPMHPAVISIGMLQAGGATNVIPSEVVIAGTIRSFDPAIREQLHAEVDKAFATARLLGGDYSLDIVRGYPAGNNDETVTQWMDDVATEYLGSDKVDRLTTGMGAEDFAYMQQLVPGTMMMIGAEVGDINRPHHTPVFDIDERAMPLGAAILAETVRRYLSK